MPLYDYVNKEDNKDVLRDQYYKDYKAAPNLIKLDDKEYVKAPSSGSFRVNGYSYANGYSKGM